MYNGRIEKHKSWSCGGARMASGTGNTSKISSCPQFILAHIHTHIYTYICMYVCFYVWRRLETIWKHVVVPKLCQNHSFGKLLGVPAPVVHGPHKAPFFVLGPGGVYSSRTNPYVYLKICNWLTSTTGCRPSGRRRGPVNSTAKGSRDGVPFPKPRNYTQ